MANQDFTKGQQISLANPMTDHFATFIFANAVLRQKLNLPMATQNAHKDQTLVLGGAGPSLREHAAKYTKKGHAVWGCNSAMPWLLDNGYRCTHGFCIDQTEGMMEEWKGYPDVEYLVASTAHPHLTNKIAGAKRNITFFHNYTGMEDPPEWKDDRKRLLKEWEERNGRKQSRKKAKKFLETRYEDFLYHYLFPPSVRVGDGLNSVNRAICLAVFFGYKKNYVVGADCAIADDGAFHADGANATVGGKTILMEGDIDGRHWVTKPDMIISAVMLAMMKRKFKDKLILVGDTLPNALVDKDPEFLKKLPRLSSQDYNFDAYGEKI